MRKEQKTLIENENPNNLENLTLISILEKLRNVVKKTKSSIVATDKMKQQHMLGKQKVMQCFRMGVERYAHRAELQRQTSIDSNSIDSKPKFFKSSKKKI